MADLIDRLLAGESPAVCQSADGALTTVAERPGALVAGSFNPLHAGHLGLWRLGVAHAGTCAFELSAANVSKPPLDAAVVRARLRQFVAVAPAWLTNAPTFAAKATLFPGTLFVVGHDTAERLFDARYGGVDAALSVIQRTGCRFLVTGRVDEAGRYRTAESIKAPREFSALFEHLSEREFRHDISSTRLRAAGVEIADSLSPS